MGLFFVLLEEVKREIQRIHVDGCRCNERRNSKTEGSKRLAYTGLQNIQYYGKSSGGEDGDRRPARSDSQQTDLLFIMNRQSEISLFIMNQ